MSSTIEKYLEFLWNQFQYDMDVFSKPWMYYVALLPAIGYLIFFMVKWMVLTTPVWLPFFMVLQPLKMNKNSKKRKNSKYDKVGS